MKFGTSCLRFTRHQRHFLGTSDHVRTQTATALLWPLPPKRARDGSGTPSVHELEQKHALLHFWTAFESSRTRFRGLRFNLRFDDQKSSNHLYVENLFLYAPRAELASYEETKRLLKAISAAWRFQLKKSNKKASARVSEKKRRNPRAPPFARRRQTDRQTDRRVVSKSKDVIVFLFVIQNFYVAGT